jgi:hypothetical protein
VQTIRWNATDTGNAALSNVDLAYSLDGGSTWTTIANAIADSGSFNWTVPAGSSTGSGARIRVTARAADGDTTVAFSNPFRVASGTATVLDFASGAGVNKFGFGSQTISWNSTNSSPVSSTLTAANYTALSTSNATGGITDTNRYIGTSVTNGNEATNLFRFVVPGPVSDIDEIRVRWEGFADRCTQVELYVWNNALGQWGDFDGRSGQNRYVDAFAGNRDESLVASVRSNIGNYIAADGSMRFLVYAERTADETFHDYMSVTLIRANDACTGDLDGNGSVDGSDLATLLNGWGPCSGCAGDLDGNGTIDGGDLATLLNFWGACP